MAELFFAEIMLIWRLSVIIVRKDKTVIEEKKYKIAYFHEVNARKLSMKRSSYEEIRFNDKIMMRLNNELDTSVGVVTKTGMEE